MQQLSVLDALFLATETPRTPNHLCMVAVYDPSTAPAGSPTFEDILVKVASCLPAAPSLRRRLLRVPFDIDRPYWVADPDFDLEFHVRHLALPRPGDWRQLRTQVDRLHSRPLDLARPPWELTVIDGLDAIDGLPAGCFATVLKVHHAVIDGKSGVELLNVIYDTEPDAAQPGADVVDPWNPEPVPSALDLLRWAGVHALTNPLQAVRTVALNAPPLVREAIAAALPGPAGPPAVRTVLNQKVSAHRVSDEVLCSLGDLKRVKQLVPGATLNDVCLSIIGGSMASYLTELGDPPTGPLLSIVPVSTRTPEQAGTGGNQISVMRVSLANDIDDPLARIAAIAAETTTKKAAQNGVAMPVLLDVARSLPGALIGAAVRGAGVFAVHGPVAANTFVTNVPGSPVPQFLLGCRIARSTGCLPLTDGIGLFHCVTSNGDEFGFMFTADRAVMPDPDPYLDHLRRSIEAHVALAAPAPELDAAPKRPRRRTAKR